VTSPAEATPGGRAAGPRLPKYYAVKTELLALTGSLSAGSPVPGERELARRYGTSRTTIRQALAELAVEGRLVRVHGRGTFVAEPKLAQPLELATAAGPLRAHGHRLATLLSRRALDPAGTPVEWSQSWYRGDRCKFVTRTRRPPGPGQP
jgi:DNA-binding GntR family transcriptional regulator